MTKYRNSRTESGATGKAATTTAERTLYDGLSFDALALYVDRDGRGASRFGRPELAVEYLRANGVLVSARAFLETKDGEWRSAPGRGAEHYYLTDTPGSVRTSLDGRGHVEEVFRYDAFGSMYEGSTDPVSRFAYTGKPLDAATGRYDYGFRDYDPRTGRFQTVDPIRDGENWYGYVGGDPVNSIDLLGLQEKNRRFIDRLPLPGIVTVTSAFGTRLIPGTSLDDPNLYSPSGLTSRAVRLGNGQVRLTVTKKFERNEDKLQDHTSVDLLSSYGAMAEVYAVVEGTVTWSGYQYNYATDKSIFGFGVKYQTEGGVQLRVNHLFDKADLSSNKALRDLYLLPKLGQRVGAGEVIGVMGNTGNVVGRNGGYHLDFQAIIDGEFGDPLAFLTPGAFSKLRFADGVTVDETGKVVNILPPETIEVTYSRVVNMLKAQ